MGKIKAYLTAHPNVRSAVRVFGYTFAPPAAASLAAYANDVITWAGDNTAHFPAFTSVGRGLVITAGSAASATIAYFWNRWSKTATATYLPPEG